METSQSQTQEAAMRLPENFRKQLAVAVRSIQWSYAIFWAPSPNQLGALEWTDGYYNGDIKTRKTVQTGELKPGRFSLQRSGQLRELYLSLLEGEDEQSCKRPSASLSPEDLSDAEWYFLVCMSFVFNIEEGLPGRAFSSKETLWLCDAQNAHSEVFSRSLLAKSASIQTVVCFPHIGGVVEIGVTECINEDLDLIQHLKACLLDVSKPICLEDSPSLSPSTDEDEDLIRISVDLPVSLDDLHDDFSLDSMDDCSHDCDHEEEDTPYMRLLSAFRNPNNTIDSPLRRSACSSFETWSQGKCGRSIVRNGYENVLKKLLTALPYNQQQEETDPKGKKISLLGDMMQHLKGLEAKVIELESCLDNNLDVMEQTSDNCEAKSRKRKCSEINEACGELEVSVSMKEDVVINLKCPYREYILVDLMDQVNRLHLESYSVQSCTADGILQLTLKSKFRGGAVASPAMIKQSLWKVASEGL